jgi:7 transmembrane sweet-taste receptor of 3 GCPR/Nine Cysteines Domain of family 3 GPCR
VVGDAIHRLLSDHCPQAFTDKNMLNECISGPVLLSYLYKTNLTGRTGRIQFNADGSIQKDFLVYQFQKVANTYTSVLLGKASPFSRTISLNTTKVSWNVLNGRDKTNDSFLLTSVCSAPCKTNEYIIHGDLPCCWACRTCRDNEIISSNQTACESCPTFQWPDDSKRSCHTIQATYLHLSHPVSICLLVMAALGAILSLATITIYRLERQHKLIIATNIPLSMVMLFGTFVVSAAVVTFVIQPDLSGICVVRSFGFHWGINLVHAPLSAKNILAYKMLAGGVQKSNGSSFTRLQLMLTSCFILVQVC